MPWRSQRVPNPPGAKPLPPRPEPAPHAPAATVIALQRGAGNRATAALDDAADARPDKERADKAAKRADDAAKKQILALAGTDKTSRDGLRGESALDS
jgi:hypothetical protein